MNPMYFRRLRAAAQRDAFARAAGTIRRVLSSFKTTKEMPEMPSAIIIARGYGSPEFAGTTALFVITRGHPPKVLPSPVSPERKAAKRRLDQAAAMR
jgi:ABC-type phosphate/phosphonate transport system permease subunit